ncbi:glycosyltransferase family 1 protein [Asticcacaulis sp. 201]|uniref:glycosyltransferase family 4 protein n=1 Tax=Asticcacaulis sp. 201 TaxID=3028787 RepID=UPI002915F32B|nr:glycosyltransferase family 1 protein [Asticcacaulis sp. 201]MDV6331036.1 glycosyltransferase family 1 protein [Asticcacaulis sp. 201]
MKIVLDLQGVQGESRNRGIGRYSLSLAKALVKNRGSHEVIIALNGMISETIEPIRAAFDGLLPQENIKVWNAVGPTTPLIAGTQWQCEVAELTREAFLASLEPDFVHISSLFEGFGDDVVTSIGRLPGHIATAVTFYDLIPLAQKEVYLDPNPAYEHFYNRKVEFLKKADLFLAISESAGHELVDYLSIPPERIANIMAAVDEQFVPQKLDLNAQDAIRRKFGIKDSFVMYSGATDERKNHLRLIRAFGLLPTAIRKDHQLVFVGSLPREHDIRFRQEARDYGLNDGDLVITGRVTDRELVELYSTTDLFVFPSWHEGFGLPALEALACGAPVIGSNNTSIPEVIGLESALFDPFEEGAIAAKMSQALTDKAFNDLLRTHSLNQAKKFSWDISARKTLAAMENSVKSADVIRLSDRPAYVADLIPEMARQVVPLVSMLQPPAEVVREQSRHIANNYQTGVRQLLIDVSELARHDARSGVQRVTRSLVNEILQNPPMGYDVQMVYGAHDRPGYRYARKYRCQFLGLPDCDYEDEIIRFSAGDIFLGLDLQHDVTLTNRNTFAEMRSRGGRVYFMLYDLLPVLMPEKFQTHMGELHSDWLKILARASGVVSISETVAREFLTWLDRSGPTRLRPLKIGWSHIAADINGSRPDEGLPDDAKEVLAKLAGKLTFLVVGTIEPRKGQKQILEAFNRLWSDGIDVNLVLVGREGWNVQALGSALRTHKELGGRLFWLEGISDEYLNKVYSASVCLIAASEGEGFGLPVVEAAAHGLPLIARDIPVFREIAGVHAHYFSGLEAEDLYSSLLNWLELRRKGQVPTTSGLRRLTWMQSAQNLLNLILKDGWQTEWNRSSGQDATDTDLSNFAAKASVMLGRRSDQRGEHTLFVDVSELVRKDSRSGIQRVTRGILRELLKSPPPGYRVMPVCASEKADGYRSAVEFLFNFTGLPDLDLAEEPIDVKPDDIFLGLDLHLVIAPRQEAFLSQMRQAGAKVYFIVYDLLPLILPAYFPEGTEMAYMNWLGSIAKHDGIICISRTVADELNTWLDKSYADGNALNIGYFYLGSDIRGEQSIKGPSVEDQRLISAIKHNRIFLTVSTVEPRKGHLQTLKAMERLWADGKDVCWVVVGAKGWNVEALSDRMVKHAEFGKRLFWLKNVSDRFLEELYRSADCLIFASEGEGFGLPLVEAMQHNLPVVARDLPVFREVGGDYPNYFNGLDPDNLADVLGDWLERPVENKLVTQFDVSGLSWAESAAQLKAVLFDEKWYKIRKAEGRKVYKAHDRRFGSLNGIPTAGGVKSSGDAGYLLFGPYVPLEVGSYIVEVNGHLEKLECGSSYVDVAYDRGAQVLARVPFGTQKDGVLASFVVAPSQSIQDLEVRVWTGAGDIVEVTQVNVTNQAEVAVAH